MQRPLESPSSHCGIAVPAANDELFDCNIPIDLLATSLCTLITLHLSAHCICRDAKAAGVAHLIQWRSGPCSQWKLSQAPSTVVVNPPWGLRLLAEMDDAHDQDPDSAFSQVT